MDIKPEVLEKLLAQSDARLWEMIRRVGAMNGIPLSATPPPADEMSRLRQLLQSGALDKEQAMEILKKRGAGGAP